MDTGNFAASAQTGITTIGAPQSASIALTGMPNIFAANGLAASARPIRGCPGSLSAAPQWSGGLRLRASLGVQFSTQAIRNYAIGLAPPWVLLGSRLHPRNALCGK